MAAGLGEEGFAVWLAGDGEEALELYRRHSQEIDLVLLEVRLPGLDGPQTLAALRQLNPGVRCCFLSGPFGDYTDEELLALGAVAVLHKTLHPARAELVLWQRSGTFPTDFHAAEGGEVAVPSPLRECRNLVDAKSPAGGRRRVSVASPSREPFFSLSGGGPGLSAPLRAGPISQPCGRPSPCRGATKSRVLSDRTAQDIPLVLPGL
jgi:CheY-like chemotaxis protein